MNLAMKPVVLILAAGLAACATPAMPPRATSPGSQTCASSEVRVDAAFEGGAMAHCQAAGPREFDITIRPEDQPINPSPWYAVRLTPQIAGPVQINLLYGDARHRYRPKTGPDGDNWTYVDDADVRVSDDRSVAHIRLDLDAAPVFLAGQELLTASDYATWMMPYRTRNDLSVSTVGYSLENRPIEMVTHHPESGRGSVVLIGRQHPPETTGAVAMQAFVEVVLGSSALAQEFRSTYGVVILPLLNPDGVQHGYWRHNRGSTDLNRDWGPFAQPETRAARDAIDTLDQSASTRPVLFLDFHSTNRDVFYTQPAGEDGTPYRFTGLWLERAGARLPGYEIERAERHQSDLPTAKNYMFGRFMIPAITYELGDDTDRALIRQTAVVFAEEMMAILLDYGLAAAH